MRLFPLTDLLRSRSGLLRTSIEVAFVALLAVQAARLVWIVVTPPGPLGISAPFDGSARDLAVLTRIDAFGSGPAPAQGENEGAFKLVGVRADGDGGGAAFIAGRDGPQRAYAVGEEISPGTILRAVAADHVVLARGGHTARLELASAVSSSGPSVPPYLVSAPPVRAAPTPAINVTADPQHFLDDVGLSPHLVDGKVAGYTLLPRAGSELMRSTGLQPGDVLVALNGNHLTPERYSDLAEELNASEVQLTVQRGAETRTITLKTGK